MPGPAILVLGAFFRRLLVFAGLFIASKAPWFNIVGGAAGGVVKRVLSEPAAVFRDSRP